MNDKDENIISVGMILIFFTVKDLLPWLAFSSGIITIIWLGFQLVKGFLNWKRDTIKWKDYKLKTEKEQEFLDLQIKEKKRSLEK